MLNRRRLSDGPAVLCKVLDVSVDSGLFKGMGKMDLLAEENMLWIRIYVVSAKALHRFLYCSKTLSLVFLIF